MTLTELINTLQEQLQERGDVTVLVDQLDYYGECEGTTTHVHVDWDDEDDGLRIGCRW